MAIEKKKVRIGFQTSPDIKKWVEEKSAEMGMTMSQFMSMVLYIQKNQDTVVASLPEIMKIARMGEQKQL